MKFHLDSQLQKTVARSARGVGILMLFMLGVFFTSVSYGGTSANELLNADERAWLEKNRPRLVLAVETGYAPFVFIDSKGQPAGLAQDYVRLIEAKLGVQFNQKRFASLDEIFQKVRGGEVQIVNAITNTPTRAKFLSITEPFISVPNVIIVRNDRTGKMAEHDLQGVTVSLVKSYAITEYMENRGLNLTTDIVPDDLSALLNVSFGRSDVAVIDLATASYLISQKGITNLRVAGEVSYDIQLSLGVPLDEPVLYGILQKGLSAITDVESQEIKNRWISAAKSQNIFESRQFWMVLGSVLAIASVIFAIILLWNRTLRRQMVLRKQAEMSARASEERFRQLFANMSSGAVVYRAVDEGEDFIFVDINSAVERIERLTRDDLIGKRVTEAFPGIRKMGLLETFKRVWQSGQPEHYPQSFYSDNKISGWRENFAYRLTSGELAVIYDDVTPRKQAEEALKRYKDHLEEEVQTRTADLILARDAAEAANKAKSVFLTSINHELRTPLNAILGFSNLLRQDAQLRPEQRNNLDIINRSGEHLLTLINDVLEMARIEAGKTQLHIAPFDFGALVRDVADMMHMRAQEKGLQLLIDQSSEFPRYIKSDESRLRQILINLVGNAIKFTQQGGVTMRFGIKPHDVAHHLLMEVEDSGIGISAENQQQLFQPFIQMGALPGDNKGTGLGLAITKQFVQLMGGTISVESTLGKGSLFRVELPFSKVDASELSELDASGQDEVAGLEPDQPAYRILIVEDQLENQLLLTQLMQRIGLEVKLAEDGKQGVQLFKSWQPHLIWMDRRMPVMDGVEASQIIRQLPGGKEVKIVAVTASALSEERDEMLAVGMDDFVRKPYRFNEIYDSLTRQLGVRYTYNEMRDNPEKSPPVALTAAMLEVLPPALRSELKAALESLTEERIDAALQKVESHDAALHSVLSRLVENFDYPSILNALRSNGSETEA